MKIKILAATLVLFSAQGLAGVPEYDTVGDDSNNYFNDGIRDVVTLKNVTWELDNVNEDSDFTAIPVPWRSNEFMEDFVSSGSINTDPCFHMLRPGRRYESAYAGPHNTNHFKWRIALQMKPESDLDIVIRDCVLDAFTPRRISVMEKAAQTGRFRMANGSLRFRRHSNPRMTVTAIHGPKTSFADFVVEYRTMPELRSRSFDKALYTSKALWAETLVVRMPKDARPCPRGSVEATKCETANGGTVRLREGDMLDIEVWIPGTNPNDIHYGQDNVAVEYIGEPSTWLRASQL